MRDSVFKFANCKLGTLVYCLPLFCRKNPDWSNKRNHSALILYFAFKKIKMTYEVKQLKENEPHDFCLKIHQSSVIVVCLRNGMTRIEFFESWLWSYRRWNTDQFEPCQKPRFLENKKNKIFELLSQSFLSFMGDFLKGFLGHFFGRFFWLIFYA